MHTYYDTDARGKLTDDNIDGCSNWGECREVCLGDKAVIRRGNKWTRLLGSYKGIVSETETGESNKY